MTTLESAERLGAAAMLLSLDRIVPFQAEMGVRPWDGEGRKLLEAVRWAIERNRAVFAANPDALPDLGRQLAESLRRGFGEAGETDFLGWYGTVFVHRAEDFAPYGNWYQFFSRLNAMPSRWEEVALPDEVRRAAMVLFARAKDVSALQALDKALDAAPMSSWDTGMYALHRLYAEGREPLAWVLETVRKRRYLACVSWLAERLDGPARQAFVLSAALLKTRIPTLAGTPDFPPLFDGE